MKYFKHTQMIGDERIINSYRPEGTWLSIPPAPGNTDYDNMLAEVEGGYLTNGDSVAAGTSTIEEVDDTPVTTYADDRIAAYGSIGDQLDMQYHDAVDSTTTWKDHVADVKAANPKG
jgi:hypothetical protein